MSLRRIHLAVLGLYTLLTLLLTWPLVPRITTHVPGMAQWAFDESTFIWNIWYFKHALVDQLRSPLHSELIWYPLGIDLVLYTYNFYHALAAQPLALATNLAVASNVTLLGSTLLSGYGTFLLVRYLLQGKGALPPAQSLLPALIAGFLYAFASNRSVYAALGHYDMVTTQWIPFYALMLLRSLDQTLVAAHRRKAAVLAGLFFALTGLAEMISALFLAMFTLIVVVSGLRSGFSRDRAVADREGTHNGKAVAARPSLLATLRLLSGALLIVGSVAFVLWSPVLLPILRQFLTNDFSLKGWGEAIPLSTDLWGWFTPTKLHPIFGGDLVKELRRVQELAHQPEGVGFRDLNTVFLGWASLLLALLAALRYGRKLAIWLWTSAIFGIFTLGPFLQINGRYQFDLDGIPATFPLPYDLLHYLPIIKANRAPNRNSVVLMLGLAVLVGYGCYWLLGRRYWRSRPIGQFLVSLGVAGAILFEHLAVPLPLSDARIPAVYSEIAADPRPVSVMQFPLGWRNSFGVFGPEQTQLQYFQTAHGKPMIGGNISRAPDFKLAYFMRLPFFQVLEKVQRGQAVDPDLLATAQAQTDDLLYLYNVGYVLLYPPIPQRFPYADTWQATWNFVKHNLPLDPQPFWAQDGIEAYRVIQPAGADQFALDLGVLGTFPYRGEGWDEQEAGEPLDGATVTWATAPTSHLFVPLRQLQPGAPYDLRLRLRPYVYPGSPAQTVQVTVNQTTLASQTLSGDWQEISWPLPSAALTDGLNRVEFQWGYAIAPRQVTPGSRAIGTTGVNLPIDADLKGFVDGGFIALFDEAGQQIDAAAGRKGVNITVLDGQSGAVVEKVGFDTTANVYESERLAQFLEGLAPGALALVVSNGDAAAFLTPAAVAGLRSLGAEVTLEQLRSHYFALIGVKGAPPGSAAQVIDSHDAFLRISLDRERRTLAAAVDWMEVKRSDQ